MAASLDKVLSSLSEPSIVASIQRERFANYQRMVRKLRLINPFILKPHLVVLLEDLGVQCLPEREATEQHDHPASKALENHMLNTLQHYLKCETHFIFLQKKKLSIIGYNTRLRHTLKNMNIVPKDTLRYDPDTLSEQAFLTQFNTMFIHDALHHYPPTMALAIFNANPQLEKLFATMVLPVEAIHKHESIEPSLYKIHYQENGFHYLPDGIASAAYFHSYESLDWLSIREIRDAGTTLSVSIVKTVAAHHIFLITRGSTIQEDKRIFQTPDLVTLPKIYTRESNNIHAPIKRAQFQRMIGFDMKLRTITPEDLWAKWQMILTKEEFGKSNLATISLLVDYLCVIKTFRSHPEHADLILTQSLLGKFYKKTLNDIKEFFKPLLGESEFEAHQKMLNLTPFHYQVETKVVNKISVAHHYFKKLPIYTLDSKSSIQRVYRNSIQDLETSIDNDLNRAKGANNFTLEQQRRDKLAAEELEREFAKDQSEILRSQTEKTLNTPVPQLEAQKRDKVLSAKYKAMSDEEVERELLDLLRDVDRGVNSKREQQQNITPEEWLLVTTSPHEIDFLALERDYERELLEGKINGKKKCADATTPSIHTKEVDEIENLLLNPEIINQVTHSGLEPNANRGIEVEASSSKLETSTPEASGLRELSKVDADLNILNVTRTSSESQHLFPNPHRRETYGELYPEMKELLHKLKLDQLEVQRIDGEIIPILQMNPEPSEKIQIKNALSAFLEKGLNRHTRTHRLCGKCANDYLTCMKDGDEGTISRWENDKVDFQKWQEAVQKHYAGNTHIHTCNLNNGVQTIPVTTICAAPGSRKSAEVQIFLKRRNKTESKNYKVITPSAELVKDWKTKIGNKLLVITHELALTESDRHTCIIDEAGKLPNGYLSFLIAIQPKTQYIVALGDTRQSTYHNPERSEEYPLHKQMNLAQALLPANDYYGNYSYRVARNVGNAFGIVTVKSNNGKVTISTKATHKSHLVAERNLHVYHQDPHNEVNTFSGAIGLTRPSVSIAITPGLLKAYPEGLFTAVTRSECDVEFYNHDANDTDLTIKVAALPEVKAMLESTISHQVQNVNMPNSDIEYFPNTHLIPANERHIDEAMSSDVKDKFDREVFTGAGYTNVCQTENPVVQAIPHQQSKDEALLEYTIPKRLKFSTLAENEQALVDTRDIARYVFDRFLRYMHWDSPGFNLHEVLLENARAEVERKYLSKPFSDIKAGANRQDPYEPFNYLHVQLKSQWKKKWQDFNKNPIKQGQTISSFRQDVVMLTGTMARYTRRVLETIWPKTIFVNSEVKPEDMNRFSKEIWDHAIQAYANDYTAYDQSQDALVLNFEILLYKWVGLPDWIIDYYTKLKLSAYMYLGTLSVMRLTGEGPTFDANTWFNIAYFATKFEQRCDVPAMYAGDDMVFNGTPELNPKWESIQHLFKLVAKPEYQQTPEFTGWLLTPHGILKDPRKLYLTYKQAKECNKLHDIKDSMCIDIHYAYRLKDYLYDILDEEQLDMHQVLLTRIHKWNREPVADTDDYRITKINDKPAVKYTSKVTGIEVPVLEYSQPQNFFKRVATHITKRKDILH